MKALVLLNSLPSRIVESAELNKAAYFIALAGVELYGLNRAVENILKGKLGHGFFPSPAELRLQCEGVMQPVRDSVHKANRERAEREAAADFAPIDHSPEAKARVSAAYQRFLDSYRPDGKSEIDELAEIRAKYDSVMLDAVPNAPPSFSGFQQLPRIEVAVA